MPYRDQRKKRKSPEEIKIGAIKRRMVFPLIRPDFQKLIETIPKRPTERMMYLTPSQGKRAMPRPIQRNVDEEKLFDERTRKRITIIKREAGISG